MTKSGKVNPCFIISYENAIKSINKCQDAITSRIISPHYGLVSEADTPGYWQKCIQAAGQARAFVLELFNKGCDEERIFEYTKEPFRMRILTLHSRRKHLN